MHPVGWEYGHVTAPIKGEGGAGRGGLIDHMIWFAASCFAQLELYRAHTPRAAASMSNSLCMPPVGCCRPLPTYCARLCA